MPQVAPQIPLDNLKQHFTKAKECNTEANSPHGFPWWSISRCCSKCFTFNSSVNPHQQPCKYYHPCLQTGKLKPREVRWHKVALFIYRVSRWWHSCNTMPRLPGIFVSQDQAVKINNIHVDKRACLQIEAGTGVPSGLNVVFPWRYFIKYCHIHVGRGKEQLHLR